METIWNNAERKSATIGKAGPIETKEPVAMADVAEPPGPVRVRAGGPVVAGTQFTAVADRTGASGLGRSETGEPVMAETRIQTEIAVAVAGGPAVTGAGDSVGVETGTGAGSPVMVGNRFLAVADVHAWLENREDDPPSDLGKFEPVPGTITEVTPAQTVKTRRRHEGGCVEERIRQWDTEHRLRSDWGGVGRRPSGISFPLVGKTACGMLTELKILWKET